MVGVMFGKVGKVGKQVMVRLQRLNVGKVGLGGAVAARYRRVPARAMFGHAARNTLAPVLERFGFQ